VKVALWKAPPLRIDGGVFSTAPSEFVVQSAGKKP
jgi:hypothetical protein